MPIARAALPAHHRLGLLALLVGLPACAPTIADKDGVMDDIGGEDAGDGAADGAADGATDGGADGGGASASGLRINELVAAGDPAWPLPDGSLSDWIELVNVGAQDVDLDGWRVGDTDSLSASVPLPDGVLAPGAALLLLASGDRDLGPAHLDLRLNESGEQVALFAPDGALVDLVAFGPQAEGVSAGRLPDGGPDWALFDRPTPGAPGPEGMAAAPADDPDQRVAWLGCGFETDAGDGYLTEGDRVEVAVSCRAAARLSPLRAPSGAAQTVEGLSWTTEGADAGQIDVLWASAPPTGRQVPAAERLRLSVADSVRADGATPVDPLTYTEEWGLLVIHLDAPRLSEEESAATVTVNGLALPVQAQIRGASSVSYPKQSYSLDFDEEELDLPGWGDSRNKLILTSTFDDNSGVRQKLAFDVWAAIAEHRDEQRLAPRTRMVVVYLNGQYQGLYLACDRVDDEFVGQMGFEDTGPMFKSVSHDANFSLVDAYGSPKGWLAAGWEKTDGDDDDDFSPIEEMTAGIGAAPLAEAYDLAVDEGWINGLEFMDWSIFVAFASASDSAGKNAYLYQDPDGSGMRFAPWDFNHSWGQDWMTLRTDPDDVPSHSWNNRVFASIYANPTRKAELLAHAAALRAPGAPLHADSLRERLDALYAEVWPAVQRDEERWGRSYRSFERWSWRGDLLDAEGERAYLYDWIDERDAAFDEWDPRP